MNMLTQPLQARQGKITPQMKIVAEKERREAEWIRTKVADGTIVKGANQENAAYPSGLCAERTAMFAAGARYPDKDMLSLALAGGVMGRLASQPATPCGACRQVMAQYQAKSGKPMSIIMISADKVWKFEKVDDILPLIFNSI